MVSLAVAEGRGIGVIEMSGKGRVLGGQRVLMRGNGGGYELKKADAAVGCQRFQDAAIAAAAAHFASFLDSKSDPTKRMIKFYEAIQHGMPAIEAAGFFLDLSPMDYLGQLRENNVFRHMVNAFQGDLALRQYSKVVQADGYKAAISWLKANRWEWREGGKLSVEKIVRSLPDETITRLLDSAPRERPMELPLCGTEIAEVGEETKGRRGKAKPKIVED